MCNCVGARVWTNVKCVLNDATWREFALIIQNKDDVAVGCTRSGLTGGEDRDSQTIDGAFARGGKPILCRGVIALGECGSARCFGPCPYILFFVLVAG
jgi:hypothetical protein